MVDSLPKLKTDIVLIGTFQMVHMQRAFTILIMKIHGSSLLYNEFDLSLSLNVKSDLFFATTPAFVITFFWYR